MILAVFSVTRFCKRWVLFFFFAVVVFNAQRNSVAFNSNSQQEMRDVLPRRIWRFNHSSVVSRLCWDRILRVKCVQLLREATELLTEDVRVCKKLELSWSDCNSKICSVALFFFYLLSFLFPFWHKGWVICDHFFVVFVYLFFLLIFPVRLSYSCGGEKKKGEGK